MVDGITFGQIVLFPSHSTSPHGRFYTPGSTDLVCPFLANGMQAEVWVPLSSRSRNHALVLLAFATGTGNGQIKKGIFKVGKIESDRWDFPKALWSHAVLFSPEVSLYTLPSFLSLPTFRNKSPSHIFIQCDDNITFWKAIWLHELGCLKIFILLELVTLLCKSKENEL